MKVMGLRPPGCQVEAPGAALCALAHGGEAARISALRTSVALALNPLPPVRAPSRNRSESSSILSDFLCSYSVELYGVT